MAGNANSGRKPKPIIDPMTGVESPASTAPKNAAVTGYAPHGFKSEVAELKCVKKRRLAAETITSISERLSELMGYYECMKAMQQQFPGKDDRAKQILVADCGQLWNSVTRKAPTQYFNSPQIQLAQLVLVRVGDTTANLRRMAARAKEIHYLPTDDEMRERARQAAHKTTMAGQLGA